MNGGVLLKARACVFYASMLLWLSMFKQKLLDQRGFKKPVSVTRSYSNPFGFPSPYIHKPVLLWVCSHTSYQAVESIQLSLAAAQGNSCPTWPLASAEASPAQPTWAKQLRNQAGCKAPQAALMVHGQPQSPSFQTKPKLPALPEDGLLTNIMCNISEENIFALTEFH